MLIERRRPRAATVGVFGVGHRTYWAQFPGLKDELLGYLDVFERQVQGNDVITVLHDLHGARIGHRAQTIKKVADCLGIEAAVVTA